MDKILVSVFMSMAVMVILIVALAVTVKSTAGDIQEVVERMDRAVANTEVVVNRLEDRIVSLETQLGAENACGLHCGKC